jgi:hypothetical protein
MQEVGGSIPPGSTKFANSSERREIARTFGPHNTPIQIALINHFNSPSSRGCIDTCLREGLRIPKAAVGLMVELNWCQQLLSEDTEGGLVCAAGF